MVAISGAGRGINKPPDPGIAGRNQHVDKARYVRFMTRQRIFDRARHRAQGCLMEHEVCPSTGSPAVRQHPDIALDEGEVTPRRSAGRLPHLLQITGVAGRVVIDAHDHLVELQQRLEQVGANEARDAGDEPAARTLQKQVLNFPIPGTGHKRQTVSPALCNAVMSNWLLTSMKQPCSTTFEK